MIEVVEQAEVNNQVETAEVLHESEPAVHVGGDDLVRRDHRKALAHQLHVLSAALDENDVGAECPERRADVAVTASELEQLFAAKPVGAVVLDDRPDALEPPLVIVAV